ncbi:MAG: polysaccharide deacetylase family protein [Bacteroidia bacterium]
MNKVLIYTHKITARNRYMFRLYFRDMLGLDITVTDREEEVRNASVPVISYAQHPVGDELFFLCRNLLFESGISEQNISVFEWEGNKVFFATGKASALPFDPFSAGFYLVSRYEEYLPHIRDSLDRFDAHNSLAWQNGFLDKPVVNIWANMLADVVMKKYPQLHLKRQQYQFIPTIDIDNAYAYRMKGFMRTMGGYAKALLKGNFEDFRRRTRVLLGMTKDPYDTYEHQLKVQKKYKLKPLYFFLVGDYGVNDKNISTQNRRFRELIRHISDYAEIGVHPSFGSNFDSSRLNVEISRLKNILHRDIRNSRQHFLMLKFPDTYRHLIERDIANDYSMGFANEIGFRAGISTSFNFYDLDQETETMLRVHPFAVMDATLNLYMKLKPDEAVERVQGIIHSVKAVNGTMMILWHNETLSDEREWKGWKEVYEKIIAAAVL